MLAEPSHGFFERRFDRCLGKPQLLDRLAAIVVHLVFRHPDPFKRNARLVARQRRHPFVHIGQRDDRQARQLERRGFDAGQPAEDLEDFAQQEIPVERRKCSRSGTSLPPAPPVIEETALQRLPFQQLISDRMI